MRVATQALVILLSMLVLSVAGTGAVTAADASNTTSVSAGESWMNEYDRSDGKLSETTVTGEYVYVADSEFIYKYNKTSGERVWQSGTEINTVDWGASPAISDAPTVHNNTVIAFDHGSDDTDAFGDVVAFNKSDGAEKWRVSASDTSFTVIDSTVVALSTDVKGINIADGSSKWTTTVDNNDVVMSDSGVVYVASETDNVTALNPETGNESWQHTPSDTYTSSEILTLHNDEQNNNVVVEGFNNDRTWAVNKSTGAQEWSESGDLNAVTVDDGVMAFEKSDSLHLIDTETGDSEWVSSESVSFLKQVEISSDTVYVSDYDVVAFDRDDGSVLWEHSGDRILANTEFDGVVFASADEGSELVALDAMNGDELWSYSVEGVIVDRATESGDWLFTGSTDTANATASMLGFDTAALGFEATGGGGGGGGGGTGGGFDGDGGGGFGPVVVAVLVAGGAFAYLRD